MSTQVTLSASQPVRRIIKGDTLSLYFATNGLPLFQGLDPNTYVPTPAWSDDIAGKKCPVITPNVGSARGNAVTLVNHKWKYNGSEITFPSGSGWVKSTNFDGKFKLDTSNGSLAIIGNLASKTNQDSDILNYSGTAMMSESSYALEKSIDILVSMLGGSSFFGGINATSTVLNETTRSTSLTTWLLNATGGNVSSYQCAIYRGYESEETKAGEFSANGSVEIHRDKINDGDKLYVDSHQLFIVTFIVDGNVVYRTGISIDDIADLYQLTLQSTGEVDSDSTQVFKCKVTKTTSVGSLQEVTPSAGTVDWSILDNEMKVKRTLNQTWAEMNGTGLVVNDADTRDDNNNIIGVMVNCDVLATI